MTIIFLQPRGDIRHSSYRSSPVNDWACVFVQYVVLHLLLLQFSWTRCSVLMAIVASHFWFSVETNIFLSLSFCCGCVVYSTLVFISHAIWWVKLQWRSKIKETVEHGQVIADACLTSWPEPDVKFSIHFICACPV